MNPVRFVLACPRIETEGAFPNRVSEIGEVCGDQPAYWHDANTPALRRRELGTILGVVFSRSTSRRLQRCEAIARPQSTLENDAASFVADCWGGYFAILSGFRDKEWAVLVDPSGYVPAYRIETDTHVVIGSDPVLIAEAIGREHRISYGAIVAHLLRPELRQRPTCLHGVEELVPGTLYRPRARDTSDTVVWQAEDFLPAGLPRPFADSAEHLREISRSVMGCWSEHFGNVGVAASGGVDSSVICAALATAERPFDCITVMTSDRSGDESVYAKQVASRSGVRCAEALYDPLLFDPSCTASDGLPRPGRRAFLNVLDHALVRAADEFNASVVFDGNGGDNLFCFLHSSAPVVDRLLAEGPGSKTLATLFDMCRITGCSIPTMLKATLRRLSGRRSRATWPADTRFLARAETPDDYSPLSPWLESQLPHHSGKRDHLALIMHAQNHIHGLTSDLRRFSPLASQPLVEFCLGVPTWIWAQGGQNRALARAAFAADLPASILSRTSKSGPDSFIRAAFARNRAAIAERLLDGLLAANSVLDTVQVERALAVDEVSDDTVIDRLLDLLEAENWARSWIR